MPRFEIQWLGHENTVLDTYEVEKENKDAALRAATSRMIQSQHLVPEGCIGVLVQPAKTMEEKLKIYNKENP